MCIEVNGSHFYVSLAWFFPFSLLWPTLLACSGRASVTATIGLDPEYSKFCWIWIGSGLWITSKFRIRKDLDWVNGKEMRHYGCENASFFKFFGLGLCIWKMFWTVDGLGVSFKKSGLDLGCKIWQFAHLCFQHITKWEVAKTPPLICNEPHLSHVLIVKVAPGTTFTSWSKRRFVVSGKAEQHVRKALHCGSKQK